MPAVVAGQSFSSSANVRKLCGSLRRQKKTEVVHHFGLSFQSTDWPIFFYPLCREVELQKLRRQCTANVVTLSRFAGSVNRFFATFFHLPCLSQNVSRKAAYPFSVHFIAFINPPKTCHVSAIEKWAAG